MSLRSKFLLKRQKTRPCAQTSRLPDKPTITLEQLKPYYRGVYFATVSMNKKLVDEGLQSESIAKRVNDYQGLVSEYNAAIEETLKAKGG